VNLSLEPVNAAPHFSQLRMIVPGQRAVAPLFQLANAGIDRSFIDSDYVVVLVHLDIECPAYGYHQVFFVELRVALYRIVLDVFGYVAQLGQCFVSEFVMCVCHYQPFLEPAAVKKRPVR